MKLTDGEKKLIGRIRSLVKINETLRQEGWDLANRLGDANKQGDLVDTDYAYQYAAAISQDIEENSLKKKHIRQRTTWAIKDFLYNHTNLSMEDS